MTSVTSRYGPTTSGGPLCAGSPEVMFPVVESQGRGAVPTAGERAALAVCARCPVLEACRVAVLGLPLPYGVAGGLTAAQRRELRAERRDVTEVGEKVTAGASAPSPGSVPAVLAGQRAHAGAPGRLTRWSSTSSPPGDRWGDSIWLAIRGATAPRSRTEAGSR